MRLIEPMLDDVFGSRDPATIAWLPWAILALFASRGIGVFMLLRNGRGGYVERYNAAFAPVLARE